MGARKCFKDKLWQINIQFKPLDTPAQDLKSEDAYCVICETTLATHRLVTCTHKVCITCVKYSPLFPWLSDELSFPKEKRLALSKCPYVSPDGEACAHKFSNQGAPVEKMSR